MLVELPNNSSIEISIQELRKLVPHERVIPVLLESVVRDMEKSGIQKDPILIDKKSFMVLDGMHRRAALENIGAKYALCSSFDYQASGVSMERWLRYFYAPNDFLEELQSLFELEISTDLNNAIQAVDLGKSPVALLSNKKSYISDSSYGLETVYQRISKFDSLAIQRKIEVNFRPRLAEKAPSLSDLECVLYPMVILKEQAVRFAHAGMAFPYKTTRHTFPVRPMGVNFPIELLKQSDRDKCEAMLEDIVRDSEVILIEPKTMYENREYSEPLAIFKQKNT